MARAVAKSRMKARICPQPHCARGGCAAAPPAPAGPYLGTAEGAQQRVDLVDAADQLRPAQPRSSDELVVILARRCLDGVSSVQSLATLAAGRVGVVAPVADSLLGRLRNVVDDPRQELEYIPARLGRARPALARGSAPVQDVAALSVPLQPLQDDRTSDHVPAETHGALPVFDPHRSVRREAAVAPGEEVVDDRLGDQLLAEKHA